MRAGALVGQMHDDDVVQQLLVDLAAELGRIDIDAADLLALAVDNIEANHLPSTPPVAHAPGSPARQKRITARHRAARCLSHGRGPGGITARGTGLGFRSRVPALSA